MNLFIDTHLNDIVIILFDNNNKIIKKETVIGIKENSKYIMPTITKVLDGKMPTSVAVVNGPGSFTGVRLGVTIAKTFAYTLNIPIKCITTLECLAVSSIKTGVSIAFNDKNGYYIGKFNNEYKVVGDYNYLSNEQFEEYKLNNEVITPETIDYDRVVNHLSNINEVNVHIANPIYIKKIDVEK